MLLIWSLDFIYLEIVLWMVVFLVYFVSSYCFIWSEVVNIQWPLNRMIWKYWILISFFYRERFLPSRCTNKQFVVSFRVCLERTYFVKNENWKLRFIFNEEVDKKWSLWDSWTVYKCTVHRRTGQPLRLKRKKKKKNWGNANAALISAIQTSIKLYGHVWAFEM